MKPAKTCARIVFALSLGAMVWGAEGEPANHLERESAEAEEETAAESTEAAANKAVHAISGLLRARGTNPAIVDPEVLGILTLKDGTAHQIKLVDCSMLPLLARYYGKEILLRGRFRNKGKYLIVQEIVIPEPPPRERGKRGGV